MHLNKKLIALCGLAFAAIPFTHADDSSYVRMSAVHVMPKSDSSDDTTGAMIAFGATFDNRYSDTANQFELEVGYAKWDYSEAGVVGAIPYTAEAELTFVPVLVTYRYQWNFSERVGLAVGPSVGMTYIKGSGSANALGTTISVSDNDWVFSYGAGAQLNIQLTENAAVTLGYRYLLNDDATLSVLGTDVKLEDLDTHLFEIGLSVGWPL
jgi:opacity protein-like surface antigen